jgi:uncharacterized protein
MYATRDFGALEELERYALSLGEAIAAYAEEKDGPGREAVKTEAAPLRDQVRRRWLQALEREAPLTTTEMAQLEAIEAEPDPLTPSSTKSVVIVLKATRLCNLRCVYCNAWAEGEGQVMTFPVMARVVRQLLRAPGVSQVDFVWHGGEVTLLKPKVFRKLVWLQQRFRRPGQAISNSIQTNACAVSDEWLGMLAALNAGVGISVDGPPEVQDRRRPTVDGGPSSALVEETVGRLRRAGTPHAALVVIDRDTIQVPQDRMLDYFASIGLSDIDFLNYVPGNVDLQRGGPDPHYVSFAEFCRWMQDVYVLWRKDFRDRLRIRFIEDLRTALAKRTDPANCYFSGDCLKRIFTVEPNGGLAPCDKFIGLPHSHYGDVTRRPLADLPDGPRRLAAQTMMEIAPEALRTCHWSHVCKGACPHDRLAARRLDPAFDAGCCGMAGLLDQIAKEECDVAPAAASTAAELVSDEQQHRRSV